MSQPSAVIDLGLTAGVHQVIIAANDVGDAHIMIIHHDGEIIGGIAVAAQQHEIVKFLGAPAYLSLNRILDHRVGVRGAKAHDERRVCRRFGRGAVAPG
jgi:hypothetical protein